MEYVDCSNSSGGGGGENKFAVYPNPATSEINIAGKTNNNSKSLEKNATIDHIISLRLYDFSQNVLIERKSGSLKSLDISEIKQGIYYLEITTNKMMEVHKIIVDK